MGVFKKLWLKQKEINERKSLKYNNIKTNNNLAILQQYLHNEQRQEMLENAQKKDDDK